MAFSLETSVGLTLALVVSAALGTVVLPRPKPAEFVTVGEKADSRSSPQKQLKVEHPSVPEELTDEIRLLSLESQLKDALRQTQEIRVEMKAQQLHEQSRSPAQR